MGGGVVSGAKVADRAAAPRRFKPYPAYKDSGVEWLGEIPAHWDIRRLKTVATVQLSNVDKKSVEGQESVRLCNYVDVYHNEHIASDLEFMAATATPEQVRRFSLHIGDVLITKDSESWTDIAVPAVVSSDLPDVLCGYHLALVRPGPDCDGAFLARAFSAIGPRDQFQVAANGITRFGLGGDAIRTGLFAMPPAQEQRAIAAFLDRETARIDALVAKKERLIELLQEKRTALITRAVTKGLDPNVPMKDSGVEWLDQYPAHWTGLPLKRWVATKITDGPHETPELVADGVDFISAEAVSNGRIDFEKRRGFISPDLHDYYCRKCRPVKGNILICKSGATTGKLARVDVDVGFSVWSPLAVVRSNRMRVLPGFLEMALGSEYVQKQIERTWSAGTQPNISMGDLEQLFVLTPKTEEQVRILGYVDQEVGGFDELGARVREAIDRLKELRIALISAAVTGKIDVREEGA
jgi:type I restriction enzyme S subunit